MQVPSFGQRPSIIQSTPRQNSHALLRGREISYSERLEETNKSMKLFAIVLILGTIVPTVVAQNASPAPANPTAAAPTTSPALSPEELATKYVELWNTGNFDLINSIFEFPVIMTSQGNRERIDANVLRRVISSWRHAMPDLSFKVDDTIVQGQKVVMRLVFTGTYKQRLFPNTADPTGHERGVRGNSIWIMEVKDGKLRQLWELYDETHLRYQMGGFWRTEQDLDAMQKKSGSSKSPSAPDTKPAPKP